MYGIVNLLALLAYNLYNIAMLITVVYKVGVLCQVRNKQGSCAVGKFEQVVLIQGLFDHSQISIQPQAFKSKFFVSHFLPQNFRIFHIIQDVFHNL